MSHVERLERALAAHLPLWSPSVSKVMLSLSCSALIRVPKLWEVSGMTAAPDFSFLSCRSTAYTFNPKPASPSFLSHSLVELLNQISPTFKKNFSALQKKR